MGLATYLGGVTNCFTSQGRCNVSKFIVRFKELVSGHLDGRGYTASKWEAGRHTKLVEASSEQEAIARVINDRRLLVSITNTTVTN